MSNRMILILILASVLAIGAFMVHEENESPAEKTGEAVRRLADDAGDAIEDAAR